MPFVNLYLARGCPRGDLEACAARVTEAIAGSLEHTLPRMVRISIYEIPEACLSDGGAAPDTCAPTLVLQLGPGRSQEAVGRCLEAVVEAVHAALHVPREKVRFYVERVPGENFAIGGKPKDFQQRV